jgi:hypothetical protein
MALSAANYLYLVLTGWIALRVFALLWEKILAQFGAAWCSLAQLGAARIFWLDLPGLGLTSLDWLGLWLDWPMEDGETPDAETSR